ncbi:hypothetical protein FOZ60_000632 [Perkinsus olseni]|uniref:Elongation factor G-like domain-containing protein n=1 Tax=Perkinsus olseni TaxID=32597 RepID=A0A7J6MYH4_PEROL|nr:hypothetical protein FOZ60_000632 [Perkinsus olseni]
MTITHAEIQMAEAIAKKFPDRTYSGYDQSRNGERVEITPDEKKPFLGMAFKSQDLPPNGTLTYMRVYQGSLKKGQSVVDTKTNKRQSLKKLLRLHSSETREVTSAGPGDIVACTGLDVFSGVTCTDGERMGGAASIRGSGLAAYTPSASVENIMLIVTTGEPRVSFRGAINERYGKVTGYFEPLSYDEVQRDPLQKYQGEITPMNASKYLTIFRTISGARGQQSTTRLTLRKSPSKAAAQGAFEQAFYGGSPTILQPVMKGLVTGSEALTDLDTLVELRSSREHVRLHNRVEVYPPGGHGEWAMDFHAYEEMPADDQESVKKQYVQRRAREKKLEEPDSALIIAGDIGGTNCRLRLLLVSKAADKEEYWLRIPDGEEPKTKTQLLYAAKRHRHWTRLRCRMCVCCWTASDVKNNRVARIANIPHWVDTDGDAIAEKLGLGKIVLLNDFESACWGEYQSTRPGHRPRPSLAFSSALELALGKGVFSNGTSHQSCLGACFGRRVGADVGPRVLMSQGEEFELLKFVKEDLGVPRPALPMLTRFYGQKEGMDLADLPKTAPEVAGKYGSCPVCTKACDKAMEILGRELAFLCLKFKPQGGIFLIGNVVDSLRDSILADGSSLRKGLFHSLYHPILEGIVRDTPINIVDANGVSMGMEGAINRATRLALARLVGTSRPPPESGLGFCSVALQWTPVRNEIARHLPLLLTRRLQPTL